jgi:HAD superfamily hydrolase (TIGR01509 family)
MVTQFFPDRDFKAYLFDFDGTVADTMPGHLAAWNHALSSYDLTLTKDQHHGWAGRPTREIVRLLSELHQKELSVDEILKNKEDHYFQNLHELKGIVPVMEIIEAAYGRIPMAIVSGSRRKAVETTLELLKMQHYFNPLICAEDYTHGKPAPECFLKAAQILNVQPQECLVFEDGILGIQAALSAGMECLKIEVHDDGGHKVSRRS